MPTLYIYIYSVRWLQVYKIRGEFGGYIWPSWGCGRADVWELYIWGDCGSVANSCIIMSQYDCLDEEDMMEILGSLAPDAFDVEAKAVKDAVLECGGFLPVSVADVEAAMKRVERSPANWAPAYEAAVACVRYIYIWSVLRWRLRCYR